MRLTRLHGSIKARSLKDFSPTATIAVTVGKIVIPPTEGGVDGRTRTGEWFLVDALLLTTGDLDLERGDLLVDGERGELSSSRWSKVWCSPPQTRHLSPLLHERPECWCARQLGQYLLISTARRRFSAVKCMKRWHFFRAWTPRHTRQRKDAVPRGLCACFFALVGAMLRREEVLEKHKTHILVSETTSHDFDTEVGLDSERSGRRISLATGLLITPRVVSTSTTRTWSSCPG